MTFSNNTSEEFSCGTGGENGASGGGREAGTDTRWTLHSLGEHFLYDVAHGNGTFVAVGASIKGNAGGILTSSDGANWTAQTPGAIHFLYGVTYGNSAFVAVGNYGTILTSPDGANWRAQTSPTGNWLYGVTYGNGTFVAVGYGTIISSPAPSSPLETG
jgi:hypothetical protein